MGASPRSTRGPLASLGRRLDWADAVLWRAEEQLLWTRYYRTPGDLDRAQEHTDQALARASDPRQPLALIVHRVLGENHTEVGRYDEAAIHLQASQELAGTCEAPYELALTLVAVAECAAASNDAQLTARLLRAARAICQDLGAKRSLSRAYVIEADLRRHSTDHPAGLSDREVEVLEQAVTGMTNAEIGETLLIPPHRRPAPPLGLQ